MSRPENYDYAPKQKKVPEFSFKKFEEEFEQEKLEEEVGFLM
jgi:hypothetical protein